MNTMFDMLKRPMAIAQTWRLTTAVLLVAMLGGCAGGDLYVARGSKATLPAEGAWVAVVPFENFTNHQNAGIVCAEMTQSELSGQGRFRVLPQGDIRRAMEKADIRDPDRVTTTQAEGIAKAANAEVALIGSVAEYGYQYGLREEPSVTINMRLVRISDGAVLWHASAGQVGRGSFSRESVSIVAMHLVRDMVALLMMGQSVVYASTEVGGPPMVVLVAPDQVAPVTRALVQASPAAN